MSSPNKDDKDATKDSTISPKKKSTVHKWVEKLAIHLHDEDNKRLIQLYLIDPILNHIMDRVFPYIILTCVLFSLLVILVGLTFVILLIKAPPFTRIPRIASVLQ